MRFHKLLKVRNNLKAFAVGLAALYFYVPGRFPTVFLRGCPEIIDSTAKNTRPKTGVFSPARLRKFGQSLGFGLAVGLLAVWGTGDFGLTQRWLNGVEQRALAGRSTTADHLGLRVLYDGLWLGGRVAYPQAAALLGHYRADTGDTLRFDLLYIRQRGDKLVFYDNYFFQPVARHSYARFRVGKIGIRLNDGLIQVAYPQARAFVAYGMAKL